MKYIELTGKSSIKIEKYSSRVKNPLELLTGKTYGNWLDILGY